MLLRRNSAHIQSPLPPGHRVIPAIPPEVEQYRRHHDAPCFIEDYAAAYRSVHADGQCEGVKDMIEECIALERREPRWLFPQVKLVLETPQGYVLTVPDFTWFDEGLHVSTHICARNDAKRKAQIGKLEDADRFYFYNFGVRPHLWLVEPNCAGYQMTPLARPFLDTRHAGMLNRPLCQCCYECW